MNKSLEKLEVPGTDTYRLVVPRRDVEKKEPYYQLELALELPEE